ncbi:hypothetical protein BDB00DRAFT_809201 [Zychaea mexicana]|uniref:uncharacterized protein n=1 Tax=Zychaea mexicana TaxID=64656 RepID=UPI0022FF30D6|nr:uncharacterized protein BDB00DRAFT_809201 [Zychaea mexicana]KAI9496524.1 hypothetical protein BDB00DRAFT_809201 [Zychaea mexicana]
MQWRPITLLLCGTGIIYLASLIQDSPYPHPVKTYTTDATRWRGKEAPDDVVLSTIGDHLYLTALRFEIAHSGQEGLTHGTGALKTGIIGSITQLRRPLRVFMQDHVNKSKGSEDGWVRMFEHRLPGAISKVSIATPSESGPDDIQFGILYHVIEDETSKHYVRIYYATDDNPAFQYKDILMPGTTWISAFSLERNEILYSRDPDTYRFRTVTLPPDLTSPPHSNDAQKIVVTESIPGDPIREFHQPRNTEDHELALSRIYSSSPDTYRVVTVDIHRTDYAFHCNFTLVDNVTTITQLSELRGERSEPEWTIWQHQGFEQQVYAEEQVDYIGFADISQIQQERTRLSMPHPMFARSNDGKAIVFPFVQTRFLTLDFLDQRVHNENGEFPELYDWLHNDVQGPYDATIEGIHINEKGNMLAVWTDYKTIYIYKRGSANTHQTPRKKPSLVDRIDIWLDVGIPESEDEINHERHDKASAIPWKLRMAITPQEGEIHSRPISSVKFWNVTSNGRQNNYLLVALKGGGVNSYLVDEAEEYQEGDFVSYVKTSWNMVTAMVMIIGAFVLNEYRNHA